MLKSNRMRDTETFAQYFEQTQNSILHAKQRPKIGGEKNCLLLLGLGQVIIASKCVSSVCINELEMNSLVNTADTTDSNGIVLVALGGRGQTMAGDKVTFPISSQTTN